MKDINLPLEKLHYRTNESTHHGKYDQHGGALQ